MNIRGVMFGLVLLGAPWSAVASLGDTVASIDADRAQMKGSLRVRPAAAYEVHEIESGDGSIVREFVSGAGVVFAVSWQGQFTPDLQQLLGKHFDRYSAGLKAQKAAYVGRRPLDLELPGLVVQKNGHVRSFVGRAYIPEQVPLGVKLEELW